MLSARSNKVGHLTRSKLRDHPKNYNGPFYLEFNIPKPNNSSRKSHVLRYGQSHNGHKSKNTFRRRLTTLLPTKYLRYMGIQIFFLFIARAFTVESVYIGKCSYRVFGMGLAWLVCVCVGG